MHRRIPIALTVALLTVSGCASVSNQGAYSGLEPGRLITDGGFANYYVFRQHNNAPSDARRLMVYLRGSGMTCALGTRDGATWTPNSLFVSSLVAHYRSTHDLLIPEKLNIEIGKNETRNAKVYSHYTLEELVSAAAKVIDTFVSQYRYREVVLVGASEGACILGAVYRTLAQKDLVSKAILISGGGMSQLEEFRVLAKGSLEMPKEYREILSQADSVAEEIERGIGIEGKWYAGLPYCRWRGFFKYRPIEDLVEMDVPLLMINGEEDTSLPVESARLVVEEFQSLNKNNLTYIEYKGADHSLNKKFEQVLKDMDSWLAQ